MRDEHTLSNQLIKLFYALLAWFPCQFAFGLAWEKLGEVPQDFIVLGAIYCLAVFGACLFLGFPKGGESRPWTGGLSGRAGAKLLIFMGAAAALVRIWVILTFDNPPLSNYQEAHETAIELLQQGVSIFHHHAPTELASDEIALYHTIYPSWALYMLVLKNVYAVFGSSVYVGQYLNVFLTLAVMAVLYLLCTKYLKNPGLGLASAAIFAFWPPSILHSTLHSPDYFTILLMGVCLLLWGWVEDKRQTAPLWKHLLRLIVVGMALGVLNRFKSVAVVILAALLIYESVCHILPALCRRVREKTQGFRKALGMGILTVAAVALAMQGTTKAVDWAIARNIGSVPQNLTGWFFYVGLTGEDGMWTPGKRDYRDNLLLKYNYDIDAVNRELLQATWTRLDTYTRDTWDMILEKTETFWTDDLDLYRFMYGGTMDHLYDQIKGSSRVFYMVFLFFLLAGAVEMLLAPSRKSVPRQKERGPLLLAGLMLFGFALMFLVSEMQIRYKFILAVPMALIAGNGVEFLKRLLCGGVDFCRRRLVTGIEKSRHGGPVPQESFQTEKGLNEENPDEVK